MSNYSGDIILTFSDTRSADEAHTFFEEHWLEKLLQWTGACTIEVTETTPASINDIGGFSFQLFFSADEKPTVQTIERLLRLENITDIRIWCASADLCYRAEFTWHYRSADQNCGYAKITYREMSNAREGMSEYEAEEQYQLFAVNGEFTVKLPHAPSLNTILRSINVHRRLL